MYNPYANQFQMYPQMGGYGAYPGMAPPQGPWGQPQQNPGYPGYQQPGYPQGTQQQTPPAAAPAVAPAAAATATATARDASPYSNAVAGQRPTNAGQYRKRENFVKAKVIMLSGCMDEQTSADVSDVSSFGLPANVGPGGAGGACTNALQHCVHAMGDQKIKSGQYPYNKLLADCQRFLKRKQYTQVPQLSASYPLNMSEPFKLRSMQGRTKALLIGINYTGHGVGELTGCHNDVKVMKQYVTQNWGFSESPANMKVLMDDGRNQSPTKANILAAFRWLVSDVRPGDSLFIHYSGHGSQQVDYDGDEESGYDSTMVPLDYKTAGQIVDDDILAKVVLPLPEGCEMFALMDCCHSGTIMDLEYNLAATDSNMAGLTNGTIVALPVNVKFSKKQKRLAAILAAGAAGFVLGGGPMGCIAAMCCAAGAVGAHSAAHKMQKGQL